MFVFFKLGKMEVIFQGQGHFLLFLTSTRPSINNFDILEEQKMILYHSERCTESFDIIDSIIFFKYEKDHRYVFFMLALYGKSFHI